MDLAECLTRYKEIMSEDTTENNSLIQQATMHLTSILTKQLLKVTPAYYACVPHHRGCSNIITMFPRCDVIRSCSHSAQ